MSHISSAIDRQTSNKDFKCNLGTKYSTNATIISKAKSSSKFLFVVACKVEKSDIERGEKRLRGLLGLQIADDFIIRLLDSIPDPERLKTDCGPTEWVVCTQRTVEGVRQAFTSNKLDENTEGDDKCWDKPDSLVEELKEHLPEIRKPSFVFEHNKGKFQEEHYVSL